MTDFDTHAAQAESMSAHPAGKGASVDRGPFFEFARQLLTEQQAARAAKLTAVPDADADVVDLDAARQMRGRG